MLPWTGQRRRAFAYWLEEVPIFFYLRLKFKWRGSPVWGRGVAYFFAACLSPLTIGHVSLASQSTPDGGGWGKRNTGSLSGDDMDVDEYIGGSQ